jgi:molybdate transport system substrate-binding protein
VSPGAAVALGLAIAGAGAAAGGCGGSRGERLVVSAAASMTEALQACRSDFPAEVRLSLAGSDELAAQIRQGVKPDVFAAANATLPRALASEERLSTPVEFATNELVLAVPAEGARVRALDDLTGSGVAIAIGSEGVPIGSYTRELLARIGERRSEAILANVRSSESDVKGIVAKLTQGAVDAGFTYASDVEATGGRLRAIELPARLQPSVTYAAGVVQGARRPRLARRYVRDLVGGPCGEALRMAGFGAPPR